MLPWPALRRKPASSRSNSATCAMEEDDDDEDDDGGEGTEHGGEEHGGIAAGGCAMWRYDCRCGDEFALREHQLADAIPCRSCSLVLKVVDAASRARAASTS